MNEKSPKPLKKEIENCNPELEEFSKALENLIVKNLNNASKKTAGDEGLVIAIDAKWGSGKTTFLDIFEQTILDPKEQGGNKGYLHPYDFTSPKQLGLRNVSVTSAGRIPVLKMWEAQVDDINKKKVNIIRYNAWENDYFNDPFMSLVGQFCAQFSDSNKKKSFINKAFAFIKSRSLLKESIGTVPVVGKVAAEAIETYRNLEKNLFDEQLNQFISLTDSRRKFKEALLELTESSDSNDSATINLFLIDELDRCNPKFAINLLEILKHFFNTPNSVFLVTLDKSVLVEHIKHYYGSNIDGERYLSRLFDFEFRLPVDSQSFYDKLIQKFSANIQNNSLLLEIRDFFLFSPRDWIKYLTTLQHLARITTWNIPETYILLAIKIHSDKAYKDICALKLIEDNPENTDTKFREEFFLAINPKNAPIDGNALKSGLTNLFNSTFYCRSLKAPSHITPEFDKSQLIGLIRTIEHMF